MALADNPKEHILHMFGMEMRSREDHNCEVYPKGSSLRGLPLAPNELVYGVFAGKLYFSPESLIWQEKDRFCRLEWKRVVSCSTEHGWSAIQSEVTLDDGTRLMVPIGRMSVGWNGRIGQLYHAMITRWRKPIRDPNFVFDIDRFFEVVEQDDAIAPNWYPSHPGLVKMRAWLEALKDLPCRPDIYLIVTDYDGDVPCVQEVVFQSCTPPLPEQVEHLAFSYLGPSHRRTNNLMGAVPGGSQLTSGIWD